MNSQKMFSLMRLCILSHVLYLIIWHKALLSYSIKNLMAEIWYRLEFVLDEIIQVFINAIHISIK